MSTGWGIVIGATTLGVLIFWSLSCAATILTNCIEKIYNGNSDDN